MLPARLSNTDFWVLWCGVVAGVDAFFHFHFTSLNAYLSAISIPIIPILRYVSCRVPRLCRFYLCDARAKAKCVLLFVTVFAPGGIASKRESVKERVHMLAFERESTCSRSSESPHARVERESTRICLVLPRLSSGAFVERESPHASASERESTLPIPLTRLVPDLF